MKDNLLPILIIAVFIAMALFMLISKENREKAPSLSLPSISSSSTKASTLDATKTTEIPRN